MSFVTFEKSSSSGESIKMCKWRRCQGAFLPANCRQFSEQKSPTEDVLYEGSLIRKHEWESTAKRASNRSWDKLYMVLRGQSLIAYKDQKSFKSSPNQPYKGETALDLKGAASSVANDYTKKRHVFRVK